MVTIAGITFDHPTVRGRNGNTADTSRLHGYHGPTGHLLVIRPGDPVANPGLEVVILAAGTGWYRPIIRRCSTVEAALAAIGG